MKKIIPLLLVLVSLLGIINAQVKAEDYSVSGNAAGSSNSISVSESDSSSTYQSNTSEINNIVNQGADTGGNSNGSVTGDATSIVNINNQANTNNSETPCCVTPDPSQDISPTQGDADDSTNGGGFGGTDVSSGDTGSSSGSTNGSTSSVGGGEILGLSATSAVNYDKLITTLVGSLCLLVGSLIIGKNRLIAVR